MTDSQEKYYPTKIAADLIGFDKSYLTFLIRNGQVQARTISRGTKHAYLIPESEVERLMELRELRQAGHDAALSGSAISIKNENDDISTATANSEKTYSSFEVAKLIGCSTWTIRNYAMKGVLTPTKKPGKGRTGYVYMYNEADVEKLKGIYSETCKYTQQNNCKKDIDTTGDISEKPIEKAPEASRYDSELAMYIAKEVAKAYAEGFKEGFKTGLEAMK